MSFYASIADYYDYIFPFNSGQLDFIISSTPPEKDNNRLLDIGCATGSLSIALSEKGYRVTAIDYDEKMIEAAKRKGSGEDFPEFRVGDMRTLIQNIGPSSHSVVTCFGNTLVHLTDPREIDGFLNQARAVLKPGGRLFLQIINYDRILDRKIDGLPAIENDKIHFERKYHYLSGPNLIEFRTSLTVKEGGEKIDNKVLLYPLRKNQLQTYLQEAGFHGIEFFGSFRGDSFSRDSVPLIVKASM